MVDVLYPASLILIRHLHHSSPPPAGPPEKCNTTAIASFAVRPVRHHSPSSGPLWRPPAQHPPCPVVGPSHHQDASNPSTTRPAELRPLNGQFVGYYPTSSTSMYVQYSVQAKTKAQESGTQQMFRSTPPNVLALCLCSHSPRFFVRQLHAAQFTEPSFRPTNHASSASSDLAIST